MLLTQHGYAAVVAESESRALEVCTENKIEAVLIDQCYFAEPFAWQIPSTLKKVCPNIGIILLLHGLVPQEVKCPTAVDCIVADDDFDLLLEALSKLLQRSLKH